MVDRKNKRIKRSRHGFGFANQGKLNNWDNFLNEYQKNYLSMSDFVWNDGFEYSVAKKIDGVIINEKRICCPSQGLLDIPKYFNYKLFESWLDRKGLKTRLSARALSSLTGQVCASIKSVCKKQSERIYRLGVLRSELEKLELNQKRFELAEKIEELKKNIGWLERKIKNTKLTKPSVKEIEKLGAELSSKCAVLLDPRDPEIIKSLNKRNKKDGYKLIDPKDPSSYNPKFDYVLRLQSLGKDFGTIYIPIFHHKHSRKLQSQSEKVLGSFLIYKNEVDIRWELKEVPKKEKGRVVGGDTGLKTILTLSDGQTAGVSADWASSKNKKATSKQKTTGNKSKKEQRRKSLDEILDKLARKKPGSKAFERAQAERTNEINRSINKLNLDDIKEIRVEKVKNIFYKRKRNKKMSRWTNSVIEKAIEKRCEDEGVLLTHTNSVYASQRCSQCGFVHKSNRQGKHFHCKNCSFISDADLNSAKNHERLLKTLPDGLRHWKLNLFGFFWTETSIYLPLLPEILTEIKKLGLKNNGEELESLLQQKDVLSRIVSLLDVHSALQNNSLKNKKVKKMNTFLSKL